MTRSPPPPPPGEGAPPKEVPGGLSREIRSVTIAIRADLLSDSFLSTVTNPEVVPVRWWANAARPARQTTYDAANPAGQAVTVTLNIL